MDERLRPQRCVGAITTGTGANKSRGIALAPPFVHQGGFIFVRLEVCAVFTSVRHYSSPIPKRMHIPMTMPTTKLTTIQIAMIVHMVLPPNKKNDSQGGGCSRTTDQDDAVAHANPTQLRPSRRIMRTHERWLCRLVWAGTSSLLKRRLARVK